MNSFPRISIITPVFNRSAELARAIASVRGQSCSDFEHVVIDDASTDDSADMAVALGDSRLRLERFTTRQGANAARNRGIAVARAPIVTFLDSDDEFLPHRLESTLRILEDEPETDVVLSSFTSRKGHRVTTSRNPDVRLCPKLLERALASHAIFIGGSSITVRREAILRCGGFDDGVRRMQDRELLLNIARHQDRAGRRGATLVGTIDWIKHTSTDSISAPVEGFVEAMARLVACHPFLMERYPRLVQYHIARRILAQVVRGRWRGACGVYEENLDMADFRFTPWRLAWAYLQGRIIRAKVVHDILVAASAAPPPGSSKPKTPLVAVRAAA